MKLPEARKILDDILNVQEIPSIPLTKFKYSSDPKHVLAFTYYTDYYPIRIEINPRYLKYGTKEEIIETLNHEVAHVKDVLGRGYTCHDETWSKIANHLGITPLTHVEISDNRSIFNYEVRCSDCSHVIEYTWKKINDKYKKKRICPKCHGQLDSYSLFKN